jgi:hypothetical protein
MKMTRGDSCGKPACGNVLLVEFDGGLSGVAFIISGEEDRFPWSLADWTARPLPDLKHNLVSVGAF